MITYKPYKDCKSATTIMAKIERPQVFPQEGQSLLSVVLPSQKTNGTSMDTKLSLQLTDGHGLFLTFHAHFTEKSPDDILKRWRFLSYGSFDLKNTLVQ